MQRRVVVTGLGVISSAGLDINTFWKNITAGKTFFDKIKDFSVSDYDTKIAAQIKNFNPQNYMSPKIEKRSDRFVQFAIAASEQAIKNSKLDLEKENKNKIAVCMGSGLGGLFFYEKQLLEAIRTKIKTAAEPLCVPKIMPNALSSSLAILYGARGPNITISTACSSSTHAIGYAFDLIRLNRADIVIAGGAEAPIIPYTFAAFDSLQVMSKRNDDPATASRPFDKDRDGFVMGEGSAVLLLEELEHAKSRNAKIYAEVKGYGSTEGAFHLIIPLRDGSDAARAMRLALQEAAISPEKVDYISAHGTSTIANDIAETNAIKKVFGDHAYKVNISAIKSTVGHLLGAAGATEAVSAILAINENIIPPTANLRNRDPECDLNYTPLKAVKKPVNTAILNSFGFGGNNASIALQRLLC